MAGFPVDWSFEEQSVLMDGLVKFVDESNIIKYIKIAALLPDKTVRDVALRCRWMTMKEVGKRRKPEEHYYTGNNKTKERKENIVDSSSEANMYTGHDPATYSCNNNDPTIEDRLEENAQVLRQIKANLSTFKIQDNIDLFCHTRNTVTAILSCMSEMPAGIMSQMPQLPVSIDENLLNSILAAPSQAPDLFGTPGAIHHLKHTRSPRGICKSPISESEEKPDTDSSTR